MHHDKLYTVEDEKKVDKEIEELERKIKAVSTGVTESIRVSLFLAWENSPHFEIPPLFSLENIWGRGTEILLWWHVTT